MVEIRYFKENTSGKLMITVFGVYHWKNKYIKMESSLLSLKDNYKDSFLLSRYYVALEEKSCPQGITV